MPKQPNIFGDEFDDEPNGSDIEELDPERQKERMKEWFFDHYTNPVDNTPYESAEGGYIYIWGGPYDAREELNEKFGGEVPDDIIEELADELNDITIEWTGNPDEQAVDEYEFDASDIVVHRQTFHLAIANVQLLLLVKCGTEIMQPFLRLLYANVITALETYLFDFFYSVLQKDKEMFRKFVEKNEEYTKKRIPLSEIFTQYENIEKTVKEFLSAISWHNLPRVRPLYKEILELEFDDKMVQELIAAIAKRHDIVHRNGRSKDGDVEVTLDGNQVKELISLVNNFVNRINDDWQKLVDSKSPF